MTRQTRRITAFNDKLGFLSLRGLDRAVVALILGFIGLVLVYTFTFYEPLSPYIILRTLHNHLGRFTLVIAVGMFLIGAYIGLLRHADVTPYFRRGTYVIFGTMLFQAAGGALLYFGLNVRPADEVHLIYGAGTVLALPFFIYVETTAPKRPAMGSYLWGFALLAGIIIRCLQTGVVG